VIYVKKFELLYAPRKSEKLKRHGFGFEKGIYLLSVASNVLSLYENEI